MSDLLRSDIGLVHLDGNLALPTFYNVLAQACTHCFASASSAAILCLHWRGSIPSLNIGVRILPFLNNVVLLSFQLMDLLTQSVPLILIAAFERKQANEINTCLGPYTAHLARTWRTDKSLGLRCERHLQVRRHRCRLCPTRKRGTWSSSRTYIYIYIYICVCIYKSSDPKFIGFAEHFIDQHPRKQNFKSHFRAACHVHAPLMFIAASIIGTLCSMRQ